MQAHTPEKPLDPHLVARLLAMPSGPDLARELLAAAQRFDSVQEVFAYRIGASRALPSALLSCSGLGGSDHRVARWLADFHPLDPLRTRRCVSTSGRGFARRICASDIDHQVYRAVCFDDPRFVDKLSFGWCERGQSLVLNFYRGPGSQAGPCAHLAMLANIGLAVLAGSRCNVAASTPPVPDIERIETRIARWFPQLPTRERQVCARTLAGWSARTIATALGIRAGTVLTYRQRAYARLGFSRATDFLSRIMA